jgi:hypothetical protein
MATVLGRHYTTSLWLNACIKKSCVLTSRALLSFSNDCQLRLGRIAIKCIALRQISGQKYSFWYFLPQDIFLYTFCVVSRPI